MSAPVSTPPAERPPADGPPSAPGVADPPPLTAGARLGVAALLLLFAGLATWGAWTKSETFDEPMYIFTAYSYVVTGDLSLNKEHPPLAKYLMGLPLLLLDVELPDEHQRKPGLPFAFIAHQPRADHHLMLFLPRLPGIALGVLLGLYVFAWARRAFGTTAGLASLSLYALNPNMLGHARVAANDFAVTVFCCATLYHVWRWLDAERQARGRGPGERVAWAQLGCGALMLGAALGCKLTALLMLPVTGLVVLLAALAWRRPVLLGRAALALFAAFGLLYLMYGGEARTLGEARQHARFLKRGSDDEIFEIARLERGLPKLFGEDTPVPMLSFLKGFDHQFAHGRAGHPTYFHGEIRKGGFPHFYVASWLFKNPEAFSLLLLLGVLAWRRASPGWVPEALLWGFVGLQFVLFSTADVQLGFKYVLPVVPLLCVAAGRVFAGRGAPASELRLGAALVLVASVAVTLAFGDKGDAGWRAWIPVVLPAGYLAWTLATPCARPWDRAPAVQSRAPLALLLAWAAAASLARQPHALMYFNEWVGGPENGWRWSVVGDDWGQDTAGLGRWMRERGLEHIHYDYYGTADPEVWGVVSTPTHATPRTAMPVEGLVAVHAAMLARFPQNYTWLQGLQPVDTIGHTIFVFDVSRDEANDKFFEAVRQPLPPVGGG